MTTTESAIGSVLRGGQEWFIETGHVIDVLKRWPDACVQTVVTSPPYYQLRDYGLAPVVWGGHADCPHEWSDRIVKKGGAQTQGATSQRKGRSNVESQKTKATSLGRFCSLCNAWEGQLGLEPRPHLYAQNLVRVFREIRRVLRDDGTIWLNLGDSYCNNPIKEEQLKPKDLIGIPWLVARALRSDGWWLRSDIIWAKDACNPESVEDRPVRSHEFIFLLTKSSRYTYDVDSCREPHRMKPQRRPNGKAADMVPRPGQPLQRWSTAARTEPGQDGHPNGKNLRTVWTINPQPFNGKRLVADLIDDDGVPRERNSACPLHGDNPTEWYPPDSIFYDGKDEPVCICTEVDVDHHATMPPSLAKRCIALGAPAGGCCSFCGKPFVRQSESWVKDCACSGFLPGMDDSSPCIVLDPFSGSGSVAISCLELGRRFLGIEMNADFASLSRTRIEDYKKGL